MNIFLNIYNNWSIYEWIMIGSTFLSIFLISNSITYLLTKNFKYCISLSLTYLISAILTVIGISIYTLIFSISISNISLLSPLITTILIVANWFSLIGFYIKYKNKKNFSLTKLFKEYKKDSIRIIIFITLSILSVSIFLTNEHLTMLLTTLFASTISIYINTVLIRKLIND
jgi:hypothetical protein